MFWSSNLNFLLNQSHVNKSNQRHTLSNLLFLPAPLGLHRIGSECTEFMAKLDDRERLQDTSMTHPLLPMTQKEIEDLFAACYFQPMSWTPVRVLNAIVMMRKKQYPNYRKGREIFVCIGKICTWMYNCTV